MNRFGLLFTAILFITFGFLLAKASSADIRKIDNIGSYGGIHIFRANPDIIYVFGSGIYKSIDGGNEWEKANTSSNCITKLTNFACC